MFPTIDNVINDPMINDTWFQRSLTLEGLVNTSYKFVPFVNTSNNFVPSHIPPP